MAKKKSSSVIKKISRLDSVPNDFQNRVAKSQIELNKLISKQTSLLELTSTGEVAQTEGNYAIANKIKSQLQESVLSTSYSDSLKDFSKQFNVQKALNETLYAEISNGKFVAKSIYDSAWGSSKMNAMTALTEIPTTFTSGLANILDGGITGKTPYSKVLQSVSDLILGDDKVEGAFYKYTKQISKDLFAISDRTYMQVVSEDMGYEYFLYFGGIVDDSRCFCVERHDKYYSKYEIEQWGLGKLIGECNTGGGKWAGRNTNTNESTIWTYVGGYNCDHLFLPADIEDVPQDVIDRQSKYKK